MCRYGIYILKFYFMHIYDIFTYQGTKKADSFESAFPLAEGKRGKGLLGPGKAKPDAAVAIAGRDVDAKRHTANLRVVEPRPAAHDADGA